jgi:hypothetical protein
VDWAIEEKLHVLLGKLLRFASRYSIGTLISSCTSDGLAFSTQLLLEMRVLSLQQQQLLAGPWVPSNGMLAAAILSLCAAFSHGHVHAKQCLASTGEVAALAIKGRAAQNQMLQQGGANLGGGAGTALHQLITLGVSRSPVSATRWLCLNLAGSLLSGAHNLGIPIY